MSDEALVQCRLCGQRWRSLGHHLRWGHGISADEYRDRFGIRRGESLAGTTARARWSASIRKTIAEGRLDEHFAGNAARASKAGSAARGIGPRPGAPPLPRAVIAAIVSEVEAGSNVASAVKRAGIAYSAYHAGLGRHCDLKARHEAARAGIRRVQSTKPIAGYEGE